MYDPCTGRFGKYLFGDIIANELRKAVHFFKKKIFNFNKIICILYFNLNMIKQ